MVRMIDDMEARESRWHNDTPSYPAVRLARGKK